MCKIDDNDQDKKGICPRAKSSFFQKIYVYNLYIHITLGIDMTLTYGIDM